MFYAKFSYLLVEYVYLSRFLTPDSPVSETLSPDYLFGPWFWAEGLFEVIYIYLDWAEGLFEFFIELVWAECLFKDFHLLRCWAEGLFIWTISFWDIDIWAEGLLIFELRVYWYLSWGFIYLNIWGLVYLSWDLTYLNLSPKTNRLGFSQVGQIMPKMSYFLSGYTLVFPFLWVLSST